MTPAPRPGAVLLTAFVPHPAAGGPRMRAWDWARELAAEHDLTVAIVGDDPTPRDPLHALLGAAGRVLDVEAAQAGARARRWARALPPLAWWRPARTAGWFAPRGAVPVPPADRVVAFRLPVHPVAEAVACTGTRDLDLDDREAATLRSVAGSQWRLGRRRDAAVTMATAAQYWGVERRVLRRYDRVHLASPDDVRSTSGPPARAARPNRIGPLTSRAPRPLPAVPTLLFVGTLDYPPNEEAVRWLLGPWRAALRSAGGAARLEIAGRSPSAALVAALAGIDGVRLHADVPDLTPLYRGADAAIIPLRAGGGTKIKTVEAIGHGLPVIGLPEAFRGLPPAVAHHSEVVTDAVDAVRAIDRLRSRSIEEQAARLAAARRALQPRWLAPDHPAGTVPGAR